MSYRTGLLESGSLLEREHELAQIAELIKLASTGTKSINGAGTHTVWGVFNAIPPVP